MKRSAVFWSTLLAIVVAASNTAGQPQHPPLTDRTNPTADAPRRIILDVETRVELTYGATVANRYLLLERTGDAGDHDTIVDFPTVRPNTKFLWRWMETNSWRCFSSG